MSTMLGHITTTENYYLRLISLKGRVSSASNIKQVVRHVWNCRGSSVQTVLSVAM